MATASSENGLSEATEERLALVGLLLESAAALKRGLSATMFDGVGVGGQAFDILLRLERSPGNALRMSDLAAQTGLTPSGLTRAIDRLVAVGLCTREGFIGDRRGALAHLTDAGRARIGEALIRHGEEIDRLLDGTLSPEEEAHLAAMLRSLRDRLHPEASHVREMRRASKAEK